MNHPYPDNYHGGYIRGGPAGMQQQGMGYGHSGYDNPASMARMGHPRHGYSPMPQQYGDNSRGQMTPMMQQQQHPGGGGAMYPSHGGYMSPMGGGGGSHYGGMGAAGNYPGYNSMPSSMSHTHPSMSHMGSGRGQQHHHGNNMMGGGGGSSYYNSHPHHHQQQHQQHLHPSQQHATANPITSPQQTPPPNYGHQSPSGSNSVPNTNPSPAMSSAPYVQQQQNQNTTSQATHHHHPSPHNTNNMQVNNPNANLTSSSIPPTTTPTHNMPISTQAAIANSSNNNIQAQGQQQITSLQNNTSMMMPNSLAHTHGHSQPRQPVAGSMQMSMAANSGGGGGSGTSHPIPQHPMRHPTTQQSPQEVADNILQIASSYPTNQTVQVPLKGQARHAPYHIPRSPHHFNTSSPPSSTSTSTSSSITSADNTTAVASTAVATPNQFQQQQLHHPSVASPPAASSSQSNMSPSTSSRVRSPNPVLTPIPNPIPSPGISGIRSPPSNHCLSPCSSQQQRSPGLMAPSLSSSSSYSGHNQHAPSPSPSQHYSPISGGGTPQHLSASFAHSPPSYHPSSNNQANLSQSTMDNQSMYGSYPHMSTNAHHQHQQSSSPYTGNSMTSPNHPNIPSGGQYNHHQQPPQQCVSNNGNNPLMSLQKLVMLPETQVVDPKSVVNDACLAAASANESNINIDSKNCEGPAERFDESSGLSVGSSGQSSSLSGDGCLSHDSVLQGGHDSQTVCSTDESSSNNHDIITVAPADDVVDGEVNDTISRDKNETDCSFSNLDSISAHVGDNSLQGSDAGVDENAMNSKITVNGNESQGCQQDYKLNVLSLKSETYSFEAIVEESDCSSRKHDNLLQQSSSDTLSLLDHENSGNKIENENDIIKEEFKNEKDHTEDKFSNFDKLVDESSNSKQNENDIIEEELKSEKDHMDNQLSNSDKLVDECSKSLMGGSSQISEYDISAMPNIEEAVGQNEEDPVKKAENCSKKDDSMSPVRRDDAQCESKQISLESISPTVLSEVQVVMNGSHTSSNTEEEDEEVVEEVDDEECKKVTRARLRNGLKSVVRSKIAKTAKKATQFLRLTTPCTIAVGADEREVCEQFAFRRNGYCHALRASRLLYNGRGRQDSTSHGDSDESVENISDTIFHNLGTPQDGNKKKSVAKKNDAKQSNSSNQAKTNANGKESIVGKGQNNNVRHSTVSNSYAQKSDVPGHGNSREHKDVSDEDGELCYYEGVDSTDFFMNNNSSDDSFSSSPDSKKKKQETTTENAQEEMSSASSHRATEKKSAEPESKDDSSGAVSSPPAKRTRRSPACRQHESLKKRKDDLKEGSEISQDLSNGLDNVVGIQSVKNGKEIHLSTKTEENSSDRENGKVAKTRLNRRKQVFGKLLAPEEQTIIPEVLVKLEKPQFHDGNKVDVTDSPPKEESKDDSGKIEESTVIPTKEVIKTEAEESLTQHKDQSTSLKTKGTPTKKKRPAAKNRQKGNNTVLKDKDEEVKDSFKSMKFGRTLDMMKSQRKKEQNVIGPFIRVIGNHTTPKKVSVVNQAQNLSASASSKQSQKSPFKQSGTSSTATMHIVSNLSSNNTALVTSSKTVSHQTWVCAFCNHQSSFHSLGDLFGPYYREVDIPEVEHLALEEAKRAKDNEKKSDKKGQCALSSSSKSEKKGNSTTKAEKKGQMSSKADKKGPLASQLSSLKKRKLSGGKKEEGPLEIWVHQACALWAPGVYVIGTKLYGMDEAIKDAADSICSLCKEKGAMNGCLHKGCAMKYHISCAIDEDCTLDEENLSLLCPKHKDKKMRTPASSSTMPLS